MIKKVVLLNDTAIQIQVLEGKHGTSHRKEIEYHLNEALDILNSLSKKKNCSTNVFDNSEQHQNDVVENTSFSLSSSKQGDKGLFYLFDPSKVTGYVYPMVLESLLWDGTSALKPSLATDESTVAICFFVLMYNWGYVQMHFGHYRHAIDALSCSVEGLSSLCLSDDVMKNDKDNLERMLLPLKIKTLTLLGYAHVSKSLIQTQKNQTNVPIDIGFGFLLEAFDMADKYGRNSCGSTRSSAITGHCLAVAAECSAACGKMKQANDTYYDASRILSSPDVIASDLARAGFVQTRHSKGKNSTCSEQNSQTNRSDVAAEAA